MREIAMRFLLHIVIATLHFNAFYAHPTVAGEDGPCESGHFMCGNHSDICIPQINICDKIADCPDESDEINCDDWHSSNYYDNLFKKRPAAEHDDFDSFCVLPYNGSCVCRYRDIICQHRELLEAPPDLPNVPIDILDLTGNRFHVLAADTLTSLPPTDTLVLQHCEIRTLDADAFANLTTLRKLHLDNNHVTAFPDDVFPENNSLEILTIRFNEISEIRRGAFVYLCGLLELDLSYNKLSAIDAECLEPLVNLTFLSLQGNRLGSLDSKSFPPLPVATLSLEDNRIEYIGPSTFANLPSLHNLYLSRNKLMYLHNGTFEGLVKLLALTLNDNSLKHIESGVFVQPQNLTSLDFRGNLFANLDKSVLKPLNDLKHIYFDKFEMCLAAPHVRICEPKGDGISSQEHLLDNMVLRTSVWIMASIGCTGNLIVLLGRYFAGPTNNVVHSLYIKNLALSDLLMGIYLFSIASVDYFYRGNYLQHEWRWRHSALCHFCGFLNTLSCESSVLILSLVTWDRFVSVTQPLARKQPSPKAAALTLLTLWAVAGAISAAPLVSLTQSYFGKQFYGSNGVCLPLYIHNPFANGWLYSVMMFMCVNALALLFICYAYSRMIHEIRLSGVACRSTQQSQERDKVAQRFGVIVLTDCLCWIPVISFKLAALSGMQLTENYRRFVYAALAIYILPINSALNPVLYTLTTMLFRKQMRRLFRTCVDRRHDGQQHSGYDSAFSHSLGMFPRGSTKRVLTYRGTRSSMTTSKNSWKRPTAV